MYLVYTRILFESHKYKNVVKGGNHRCGNLKNNTFF